jgi:hypothetical protein
MFMLFFLYPSVYPCITTVPWSPAGAMMPSGRCMPGEAIASGCSWVYPALPRSERVLFSIGLLAVASAWFALWLVYLFVLVRYFPGMRTAWKSPCRGEGLDDRSLQRPWLV